MSSLPAEAMELHEVVKGFAPSIERFDEHLSKPSRILIAVERHDKDSETWRNELPKNRFLWIMGRRKVRMQQIRCSYLQSYANVPNLAVIIRLADGRIPDDDEQVGDLDMFQDQIVTFTAVQQPIAGEEVLNASTPNKSHDMNGHGTLPPIQTPSRQPLQPVNRQLVASPKESHNNSDALKVDPDCMSEWHNIGQENFEFKARNASPTPKREDEHPSTEPDHDSHQEQEQPSSQRYQPREMNNPFASDDPESEPIESGQSLRQLAQNTDPERLEAGVKVGVQLLSDLQDVFKGATSFPDVTDLLSQIESVRKDVVKSRTIVGVVGNTGAGKSSVINAILEEERLVPTNCMRACTAVVTELSYNHIKSESSKYRAEVEFISEQDWHRELKILFEEVFDDGGQLSREVYSPDSQAGIAYAKMRAVYPTYTKEMLSEAHVDSLMNVKQVKKILDTTKKINAARPDEFYRRLRHYVDSKEKGTEKRDKNGNKITNPKRVFEVWPLIKVVRIYTMADCLSTGAVIVDLPGVHDSNAARAAVAEGYMKQCNGLWIVAPITRAVDDKAAKNLLGNTFKRQLKYDGTYSAVTFICSKTDDISRLEAIDSLSLRDDIGEMDDMLVKLDARRREIEMQLKAAKADKDDHSSAIDDLEDQVEKWEELQSRFEAGETVYPPVGRAKKRKRASESPGARKKCRKDLDSDDNDDDVKPASCEGGRGPAADDEGNDTPLSQEQIEEKISEIRKLKKHARRERGSIDEKIRDLQKQTSEIAEQAETLDARQSELCIAGRNEYSRSAIRDDFAAGIRELDQENAELENPDEFNPGDSCRDYDEVARSLPVYCVSSRAYQKLRGRMLKDNDVPGYSTLEQTEIPQLQTHCKELTTKGRQASCRRFLHSLDQVLGSLSLWASDDGTGGKLSSQQRDVESGFLVKRLKDLENALQKAVRNSLEDVVETIAEQLLDKFQQAIQVAATSAVPTASSWGAHHQAGGLAWSTYKATVRRTGVYQGARGLRDFNSELCEPIYKQLASVWERTFQSRLPRILLTFTKASKDVLMKFHSAIETRCREKSHGIARIGMLGNSLATYDAIFQDLANVMVNKVNDGQRDINREFTPVVTAAMEPAYGYCTNEVGKGQYKRMKDYMAEHVDLSKDAMFSNACNQVKTSLRSMCQQIEDHMLERVDAVFLNMQRDYMSIIGGVNVGQIAMPRNERAFRREISDYLKAKDRNFQKVFDDDLDQIRQWDGETDASLAEDVRMEDGDAVKESEAECGLESAVESAVEEDDQEEVEEAEAPEDVQSEYASEEDEL